MLWWTIVFIYGKILIIDVMFLDFDTFVRVFYTKTTSFCIMAKEVLLLHGTSKYGTIDQ